MKDEQGAKVPGGANRGSWGKQIEFVLTVIGFAIGLGNVWRFPYLCFQHGGGAFILPFVAMMMVLGVPIFYFELSIGQFCSCGPVGVWNLSPLFRGIGFTAISIQWIASLYYHVLVTWSWRFLFASLTSRLPWTDCNNNWNTIYCLEATNLSKLRQEGNLTDWLGERNMTSTREIKTPSEEYFYREVLRMSDGLEEPGTPVWELTLCLLLSWIICFFVLIAGVRSLGKVMYVVTTFPYVMITILIIFGATLDGASDGVVAYLKPDLSAFANFQMWSDAATQVFYSLGTCSGGMIAMASYNPFRNKCLRDSLIVPTVSTLTSIYSGFAIFFVLGFMARLKDVDVGKVATQGPGLVFVVYPEGLSQMPVSPLWSVLFFAMLITLGYSTVFSMLESVFIVIMDLFPTFLRRTKWHGICFRGACITVYFFITLPMVTNGGFYLFDITNTIIGGFPMVITGFLQFVVVMWVYGYSRWADDISLMLGKKPNIYFNVTWRFLSPAMLLVLIVLQAVQYQPLSFEGKTYPALGQVVGWLQLTFIIMWLPLVAIFNIWEDGQGLKSIRRLTKPTASWGPAIPADRTGVYSPKSSANSSTIPAVFVLDSSSTGQNGSDPHQQRINHNEEEIITEEDNQVHGNKDRHVYNNPSYDMDTKL